MKVNMFEQLGLPLRLRDEATFNNFFYDDRDPLILSLVQLSETCREQFMYLWGQEGSGRSHLLQAACHAVKEAGFFPIYIPLADEFPPECLQNLEQYDLVCLDDLNAIAGDPRWEEALFHFYNRIREQGSALIVAADQAPIHAPIQLPDLRSRLSWGLTFQVRALTDPEKMQALTLRAEQRGLVLSEEVSEFLLRHYSRDMTALINVLEKLDQAALVAKRRLTIPFVKMVLL